MVSLVFGLFLLLTGANAYTGNYALSFDGVYDIVKIAHTPNDLTLSDDWTAEAWIKPNGDQMSNFQPNIVGFPGRHPNLELCGNSVNTGCPGNPSKTLAQLRERDGEYYIIVGNTPLAPVTNTWFHLAASWNNQTFTTYVNGVVDVTLEPYNNGYVEPLNCSFALCDEGLDIGGYRFINEQGNIYSRQYFTGLIDEVRVWNIGRSQSDIQKTMNTVLQGDESGLVYYYRFDEGMGIIVNSQATTSVGILGGGIEAAEPRWVQSDAPISNPYSPPPQTYTCVTSNNESGLYATAAILSIVFIIVGMVIGILVYKRFALQPEYKEIK